MPTALQLQYALQTNRSHTLTQLYQRTFPLVRHHVQQHGGTAHDAKDVFQDALLVFYEKAVTGTLVLTASAGTYVVAVARNLWRQELARRQRTPRADLLEDHEQVPDEAETGEAAVAVLDFVEQLGGKCKSILLSFYYFRESLEQIAVTHNYRTVRSATVQKFKCLERLRNAAQAVLAEAFFE